MNLFGWLHRKQTRVFRETITKLAAMDDVRAVGLLAEALWIGDKETRTTVEAALIRLLPRLNTDDADSIDHRHWQCLYRALHSDTSHVELAIALLKALEQASSDPAALSRVRELADFARGPLRQAARACLPVVEARVKRMDATQTLLRSSDAPSVPADALRQPPLNEG